VEDDPNDLDLAFRAIRSEHATATVHVARDGEEALAYLREECEDDLPRAVFLDLKLPKIDGIDVLRRIRADDRTRRLPVVVLTSSDRPADIEACYGLGVNSYVVKPVEFEKFVRAVREIGLYWLLRNEPPCGR
jgi:two-component system response regulator